MYVSKYESIYMYRFWNVYVCVSVYDCAYVYTLVCICLCNYVNECNKAFKNYNTCQRRPDKPSILNKILIYEK